MKKEMFDDYIRRFNEKDLTTFEDYIDPDAIIINGTLEIKGMQGMKDHYNWIWRSMKEELDVTRFVSDDDTLAIEMLTHFVVQKDDDDSPFGRIKAGEQFDFHGIIMYEIVNNKFTKIKVAYLTFIYTDLEGNKKELGIPH